MKVKALRTIAGPWGTFAAGDVADLPDNVAHSIILVHGAEPYEEPPRAAAPAEVKEEPVYEAAVTEAPEAGEFPPRRRRKT